MPSLFKATRPSDGLFSRINILSPQTPAKAGETLKPCRLARTPIEVRGWSRPGLGVYVSSYTMAYGELWRVDEDEADEMVEEYAIVEDGKGRCDSHSARTDTACVRWFLSGLEIAEPGTYYYVVKIVSRNVEVIGQIESAQIVVEPPESSSSSSSSTSTNESSE